MKSLNIVVLFLISSVELECWLQHSSPRSRGLQRFSGFILPKMTAVKEEIRESKLSRGKKLEGQELPKLTNKSIVFIAGFESFNLKLYKKAALEVMKNVPQINIYIFTDIDIDEQPAIVESALENADVLFSSLLFDYNKVQWIKRRLDRVPTRFCFESALELMSETKVGSFKMSGGSGAGPPAPVKAILKQFGSGKEEDKLAGYLNFLKLGPKLLQWVPGDSAKDLRTWLTVYSYWNQGALDNIVSMFYLLIKELDLVENAPLPAPVKETPATGLLHPDLPSYLSSPKEYLDWYLYKFCIVVCLLNRCLYSPGSKVRGHG